MNSLPYFWFCMLVMFTGAGFMVLLALASRGWFDDDGGDDEQ